jgi:hypothetical protein
LFPAVTVEVELLALSVRRNEYAAGSPSPLPPPLMIPLELAMFSIVRFLDEFRLLLLLDDDIELESDMLDKLQEGM